MSEHTSGDASAPFAAALPGPQDFLSWAEFYAFQMGWVIMPIHRFTGSYSAEGRPLCSCELTGSSWKSCIPGKPGKHPWVGWKQRPMETPEQGYAAWREVFDQYGGMNGVNIGVRTGPQSGIFAVDLDVGPMKNGIASLEGWMGSKGVSWDQMATLSATTGGGGCHLLYKYPATVNKIPTVAAHKAFHEAVDIKGDGGFILVAPSVHASGRTYSWRSTISKEALAVAPEPLVHIIQSGNKVLASGVGDYTPSLDELKDYADELCRKKSTRQKQVGKDMVLALTGEAIAEDGGAHDAYRDIMYFVAKRWPTCNADLILEHFRESVSARFENKADASTDMANLLDSMITAIGKANEEATEWTSQVALTDKGKPAATDANMLLYFENHPAWAGTFGYNTRANRPVYLKKPPLAFVNGHALELDLTRDKTWLSLWFQHHAEMNGRITSGDIQSAILASAHRRAFDPLQELLYQLRGCWDGVSRLDTVFQRVAGTPDDAWARLVTPFWFKSLVARILYPGCQVDTMLILEGETGFKKSSFFRTLLPDPAYFSDTLNRIHLDVESIRLLHAGPAIFEIGELSGLRKQEVEEVKAFISAPHDDLRPLYENYRKTPRRCIFVGTTNRNDYLRDETGGRRFWPLKVLQQIDVKTVWHERAQWFAEALHRVEAGERWWIDNGQEQGLATVEQDARYEEDIWFHAIAVYLSPEQRAKENPPATTGTQQMAEMLNKKRAGDFVTTKQVAENALNIEMKNARSAEGARINRIVHKLGWISAREYLDHVQVRGWRRPEKIERHLAGGLETRAET